MGLFAEFIAYIAAVVAIFFIASYSMAYAMRPGDYGSAELSVIIVDILTTCLIVIGLALSKIGGFPIALVLPPLLAKAEGYAITYWDHVCHDEPY